VNGQTYVLCNLQFIEITEANDKKVFLYNCHHCNVSNRFTGKNLHANKGRILLVLSAIGKGEGLRKE
jgi:hypothetical protein